MLLLSLSHHQDCPIQIVYFVYCNYRALKNLAPKNCGSSRMLNLKISTEAKRGRRPWLHITYLNRNFVLYDELHAVCEAMHNAIPQEYVGWCSRFVFDSEVYYFGFSYEICMLKGIHVCMFKGIIFAGSCRSRFLTPISKRWSKSC